MIYDPILKHAYDTAVAIAGEAGNVTGLILIAEIGHDGITVIFDDDKTPAGPLAATLREAADKVDPRL